MPFKDVLETSCGHTLQVLRLRFSVLSPEPSIADFVTRYPANVPSLGNRDFGMPNRLNESQTALASLRQSRSGKSILKRKGQEDKEPYKCSRKRHATKQCPTESCTAVFLAAYVFVHFVYTAEMMGSFVSRVDKEKLDVYQPECLQSPLRCSCSNELPATTSPPTSPPPLVLVDLKREKWETESCPPEDDDN